MSSKDAPDRSDKIGGTDSVPRRRSQTVIKSSFQQVPPDFMTPEGFETKIRLTVFELRKPFQSQLGKKRNGSYVHNGN